MPKQNASGSFENVEKKLEIVQFRPNSVTAGMILKKHYFDIFFSFFFLLFTAVFSQNKMLCLCLTLKRVSRIRYIIRDTEA